MLSSKTWWLVWEVAITPNLIPNSLFTNNYHCDKWRFTPTIALTNQSVRQTDKNDSIIVDWPKTNFDQKYWGLNNFFYTLHYFQFQIIRLLWCYAENKIRSRFDIGYASLSFSKRELLPISEWSEGSVIELKSNPISKCLHYKCGRGNL